jgi:hypothetical protein
VQATERRASCEESAGSPGRALAQGQRSNALEVAIFDAESVDVGQGLADVLNSHPRIAATSVTTTAVDEGDLSGFDCVVARLLGGGFGPSEATADALRSFVADGGGYVGEWWGAGAALSGSAPSIDGDYFVPERFLGLFAGRASDGNFVGADTPITIIHRHSILRKLPGVFSGGEGTEYFVRPVAPLDRRLRVLATYGGHGGTNPAIAVGHLRADARAVLLFFDAIDEPEQRALERLWVQAVHFVCAPGHGRT